ncbi:hypothetical protein M2436_001584 [Streptomyces sp. HB372]|nr:hypothetical protein [Streptomyces sp. HB372]
MRLEAITWERLAGELARYGDGLAAADGGPWLALGIDGAPAARTGESAERLAQELRLLGRAVLVISTEGFLRPARACASSTGSGTRTHTSTAGTTPGRCGGRCSGRWRRAVPAVCCPICGTP